MTVSSSQAALRVTPLGGCGEVGLNATLLAQGDDAILVDCGILLSLPDAPGVDYGIPDFGPLLQHNLHGVLITHGHEDHIGAIPWLLEDFAVPVYGPPLAIAFLRSKLADQPKKLALLRPVSIGDAVRVGPFRVELIRVTHSLPDSAALNIECAAGRVLHSGDFKLDPSPIDGRTTDLARLKGLGDQGVDLLLADSTNSERAGRTRSETEVGLELERVVKEAEGRVIVACFSTHLHRIQGVVRAAIASNRRIALIGRSLTRNWALGQAEGHLDVPSEILVSPSRIADMARDKVLVMATGTQGEGRAALARIAQGIEPLLQPEPGDRVVLSSTTIPGNTLRVRKLMNALVRRGIDVIEDRSAAVHCSGHAHREEQADLLRIVRPRCFVPVHGERVMLEVHRRTAIECGVKPENIVVIEDGEHVELSQSKLQKGSGPRLGLRFVDGVSGALIAWEEVGERRKVGFGGLVMCSVAIDAVSGRALRPPAVSIAGIPGGESMAGAVAREVERALAFADRRPKKERQKLVKSAIRRAIRRTVEVRPLLKVHLHEVDRGAIVDSSNPDQALSDND